MFTTITHSIDLSNEYVIAFGVDRHVFHKINRDKRLTGSAKLLIFSINQLHVNCNSRHLSFTQQTLAQQSGMSVKTVRAGIKSLINSGYLAVENNAAGTRKFHLRVVEQTGQEGPLAS